VRDSSTAEDSWSFLASAVAGRKLAARSEEGAAYCDGITIFAPPGTEAWLTVAIQAALAGARSLDAAIMPRLAGRRELIERYLLLEAHRAATICADRLPLAVSRRLAMGVPRTASAAHSLKLAQGRSQLPPPPDWLGTIRPVAVLRQAVAEDGLAALSHRQQQGKFKLVDTHEHDDDEATEESKILKLFQTPLAVRNPLSSWLNDLLGAGVSKGARDRSGAEAGGEIPVGRIEQALRRGVNAIAARWPGQLPAPDVPGAPTVLTYPEWDQDRMAYHPAWTSVAELDPWRPDGPQDLGETTAPAPAELRRQLATLGLDHELHRRQQDGADLDSGALIDCAIALRSGHSPPTLDIYRASRRTRRDLAVAIMVDISGSTGEADAAGRTVFQRHLEIAYKLGHALDGLGDSVEMAGFHSWGRGNVRVVRLKGHEERWSGTVGERMALLEPIGYTRIGAAIRYGADLLQRRVRLPNRLLILITDGIAYDQDYEQRYAEGDARKAIEEATGSGTACVCISVGASTEVAKLRRVFGAANLLIVDEVDQVTGRIRQVCRDALDRVSRRRTVARHAA
jgi:nitric oxide reductase NorD protein